MCIHGTSIQKCGTSVAARVNRAGPFCELCLHLQMALRVAENRNLEPMREALRALVENQAAQGRR